MLFLHWQYAVYRIPTSHPTPPTTQRPSGGGSNELRVVEKFSMNRCSFLLFSYFRTNVLFACATSIFIRTYVHMCVHIVVEPLLSIIILLCSPRVVSSGFSYHRLTLVGCQLGGGAFGGHAGRSSSVVGRCNWGGDRGMGLVLGLVLVLVVWHRHTIT